ncbi:hypothetical protein BZG36_01506 [Bifiguratus adelaidae]|uniref:Uncharacterized protein n=1 Tax=Bifiguratus adelaidae TaxID=1938954 RepID=A0A261Y4U5_9FUNG|nr:hypothetical protein BZG36_01506 [Bifiguratus adelaidae]
MAMEDEQWTAETLDSGQVPVRDDASKENGEAPVPIVQNFLNALFGAPASDTAAAHKEDSAVEPLPAVMGDVSSPQPAVSGAQEEPRDNLVQEDEYDPAAPAVDTSTTTSSKPLKRERSPDEFDSYNEAKRKHEQRLQSAQEKSVEPYEPWAPQTRQGNTSTFDWQYSAVAEPQAYPNQTAGNVLPPATQQPAPAPQRDGHAPIVHTGRDQIRVTYRENIDWESLPAEARMFVRDLKNSNLTCDDIRDCFQEFGDVIEVVLKSTFGFVQFGSVESCADAIRHKNGTYLKGNKLSLEVCRNKPGFLRSGHGHKDNRDSSRGGTSRDYNADRGSARGGHVKGRGGNHDYGRPRHDDGDYGAGGPRGHAYAVARPVRGSYSDSGYGDRADRYSRGGGRDRYDSRPGGRNTNSSPYYNESPKQNSDNRARSSWQGDQQGWRPYPNPSTRAEPRDEVVKRFVQTENVIAAIDISFHHERTGAVDVQIFTRGAQEGGDVDYDQYEQVKIGDAVSLIARAKRERDMHQGSRPTMMLTQSYARNSPQAPARAFSANPTYTIPSAPALPVDPANLASLDANVVDALINTLQQQLTQQTQVAQYAPAVPQQSWPNLGQNMDPANVGQVLSSLSASSGNPVGNPYQQNAPLQAAPGYANGANVINTPGYSVAHTASSDAGYYQDLCLSFFKDRRRFEIDMARSMKTPGLHEQSFEILASVLKELDVDDDLYNLREIGRIKAFEGLIAARPQSFANDSDDFGGDHSVMQTQKQLAPQQQSQPPPRTSNTTQGLWSTYASRIKQGESALLLPQSYVTGRRGRGEDGDSEDFDDFMDDSDREPGLYGTRGSSRTRAASAQPILPLELKRTARRTKHHYRTEQEMSMLADVEEQLVPIRINIDVDDIKLRDAFLWNMNEPYLTPEHFAEMLCEDLEIPSSKFSQIISKEIRAQVSEFAGINEMPMPDTDNRTVVNLDLQVGRVNLRDRFEWDLSPSVYNSPEAFSRLLAADLAIGGEFVSLITHGIREQILNHKRDRTDEYGYDSTQVGGHLRTGFRNIDEANQWCPQMEVLSPEELEKLLVDQDRSLRMDVEAMIEAPYTKDASYGDRDSVNGHGGHHERDRYGYRDREHDHRLPEDHGIVATAQGTFRRSETGTIDIVIIDGIEAGARTNEVGATITMTVRGEVGVLAEMITANVEGLGGRRRGRSPSPEVPAEERDRRTVFVSQLAQRLTNKELYDFFVNAGKVREAKIITDRNTKRSKGVGYVEFYDEFSVKNALSMTGQKLLGIPVIVQLTEAEKNRIAMAAAQAASANRIPEGNYNRLYVGGIHQKVTEEDLRQLFDPFGKLEFVNLHKDPETGLSRGFAFIEYKHSSDAKDALRQLNGYDLVGQPIKVGFVTDKASADANLDDGETVGLALNSQSRVELMHKLMARDSEISSANLNPVVKPTPQIQAVKTILLQNMFNPAEETEPNWAKELEIDVKEECEKHGRVVHLAVDEDSVGDIYVKYENVDAAKAAIAALQGRWFGGKQELCPETLKNEHAVQPLDPNVPQEGSGAQSTDGMRTYTPLKAATSSPTTSVLVNVVDRDGLALRTSVWEREANSSPNNALPSNVPIKMDAYLSLCMERGKPTEPLPEEVTYTEKVYPFGTQIERLPNDKLPLVDAPETSNLLDVFAILESTDAFYFISNYKSTTLDDLLRYNSGVLSSNHKKSFVAYQLLRLTSHLHRMGITHGSLFASKFYIDENLWLNVSGVTARSAETTPMDTASQAEPFKTLIPQGGPKSLTTQWLEHKISNFDYLMALNRMAGRRSGDPNFHPILPWVTDFSGSTIESSWRDFTKTKFRLNKGDEQLDFTFESPVPHHITDILSDITYYVYLARKTPITILKQYVRNKYEPNEYPSSIQRLYQWTPDECIPEFFTDPTIFASIHADMPDLQLPAWASTPEEFIKLHAEALESDYCSEHLHSWIDLTFGCKLTGTGAVDAKNVALPLLDGQGSFMKHGIVQIFSLPHPPKRAGKMYADYKDFSSTSYEVNERNDSTRTIADPYDNRKLQPPKVENQTGSKTGASQKSSKFSIHSSTSTSRNFQLETNTNREPTPSIKSSSSVLASDQQSISHSSILSVEESSGTPISSAISEEPIILPDYIGPDFFDRELCNFEHVNIFRLENERKFAEIGLTSSIEYNGIEMTSVEPASTTQNALLRAKVDDLRNLGRLLEQLFLWSNIANHTTPQDWPNMEVGGIFENPSENSLSGSKPLSDIPAVVINLIDRLKNTTAESFVDISKITRVVLSSTTLIEDHPALLLPPYMSEMYDYLAKFFTAVSERQLYLADKNLDSICGLEEEAFDLMLPTLILLFTKPSTRVAALSMFPKLGARLGFQGTKQHFLKPIVSIFETSRPDIPRELFDHSLVAELVKRFGISIFIHQLLPCYLEALIIAVDSPKEKVASDVSFGELLPTNSSAPSTVAELSGSALEHICFLIGPIATSKHVMKQLIKVVFRETYSLPILERTITNIAGVFGETFTAIQHSYLVALIDTTSRRLDRKACATICSLLSILEQLLTKLSTKTLLKELNSGFLTTLYRLLDPTAPLDKPKKLSKLDLRIQLTISMRTIDYLLNVSYNVPRSDWERLIAPLLQKYFSGFAPNFIEDGDSSYTPLPKSLEIQKNYQMVYAYSQFCVFVGQELMRRVIPTSDTIETLMYEHFSSSDNMQMPTTPFSAGGRVHPGRTAEVKITPPSTSGLMSWLLPTYRGNKSTSNSRQASETRTVATLLNIDAAKLYLYSTQDLLNQAAFAFRRKFNDAHQSRLQQIDTSKSEPNDDSNLSSADGSQNRPVEPLRSTQGGLLPWRQKWKPSPDDIKNWDRYLSTNSEEMSKTLQFSFNDLKLRTFAGHNAAVRVFGNNETSRTFVSASKDKTVKLWSMDIYLGIENWEREPVVDPLMSYNNHRRAGICDAFFVRGGGGQGLSDLVASCDGQVHLWDPLSGKTIHQYATGRIPISCMEPTRGTRSIIAGALDGNLRGMGHTWKSNGGSGGLRSMAVSHNETMIALGYSTGQISLLDCRTGAFIASWKGADSDITKLKFHPSGYLVSNAPADHLMCVWETTRPALAKTISVVGTEVVSFDIFKNEIISVQSNNTIAFNPLHDEFHAYSSKFKPSVVKSQVTGMGILPINQLLLIGCQEGEILIYHQLSSLYRDPKRTSMVPTLVFCATFLYWWSGVAASPRIVLIVGASSIPSFHVGQRDSGGATVLRSSKLDYYVAALWCVLAGYWSWVLAMSMMRRWLYHYELSNALIRLATLIMFIWSLSAFVQSALGPEHPLWSVMTVSLFLLASNVIKIVIASSPKYNVKPEDIRTPTLNYKSTLVKILVLPLLVVTLVTTICTLVQVNYVRYTANQLIERRYRLDSTLTSPQFSDGLSAVIIIISSWTPSSMRQRDIVRNTTLKLVPDNSPSLNVQYRFVLGECPSAHLQTKMGEAIAQESRDYGDLLIVPSSDLYSDLSHKVYRAIEWSTQIKYDFLIKTDDDVFVRWDTVFQELIALGPQRRYWKGLAYWNIPPIDNRENKNAVFDYPLPLFPPFTAGALYTLSHDLASLIVRDGPRLFTRNEDQNIGIWLFPFNIKPIHDRRIQQIDVCEDDMIAKHFMSSYNPGGSMQDMYNNVVNQRRLCEGFKQRYCAFCYPCEGRSNHWHDWNFDCDPDRGVTLYKQPTLETAVQGIFTPVQDPIEESIIGRNDEWIIPGVLSEMISIYSSSDNWHLVHWVCWTTDPSTFADRHWRTIELIWVHEPQAVVFMLSTTLPSDFFKEYTDRGYQIHVVRFSKDLLLKHRWYLGEHSKQWLENWEKWESGPFFFSHLTDYMRYLLLYKYGGTYMDMDALWIRPPPDSDIQFIGADFSNVKSDTIWTLDDSGMYLAPGVMRFQRAWTAFREVGEEAFSPTYRADCFNCVGPRAITTYVRDHRSALEEAGLVILPNEVLYPLNYMKIHELLQPDPLAEYDLRTRLMTTSWSIHLFGKMTNGLPIQEGSVVDVVFKKFDLGIPHQSEAVSYSRPKLVGPRTYVYRSLSAIQSMTLRYNTHTLQPKPGSFQGLDAIYIRGGPATYKQVQFTFTVSKGKVRLRKGVDFNRNTVTLMNPSQMSLNALLANLIYTPPRNNRDGTDTLSIECDFGIAKDILQISIVNYEAVEDPDLS